MALHQLFPILHCQTSSPFTSHQPSANHHQPSCYTMASSQFDTRASFSAPLSVATAAKVLLELPSLPSTWPRPRRRELTRGAILGLRASTPTMATRRSDHPGPEVLQLYVTHLVTHTYLKKRAISPSLGGRSSSNSETFPSPSSTSGSLSRPVQYVFRRRLKLRSMRPNTVCLALHHC